MDQNKIWCPVVSLAGELTAWMQMLALTRPDGSHPARRWEPKRLRLRLLSAAARLVTSGRRTVVHFSDTGPWTELLISIITRLRALPAPAG
jgi:hypothetical protein